jgi:hypothetical protein
MTLAKMAKKSNADPTKKNKWAIVLECINEAEFEPFKDKKDGSIKATFKYFKNGEGGIEHIKYANNESEIAYMGKIYDDWIAIMEGKAISK